MNIPLSLDKMTWCCSTTMLLLKKIFESFLYQISLKIIKIIFYKTKFIDFLCFKGFIPSLADLKGRGEGGILIQKFSQILILTTSLIPQKRERS